jgi:hypothetical protein
MAINLPTDGMDSLGALIQLQMLEQMRPSVPQQPINTPMSLPDLPMDTGMTATTPQGIAGVLARYAENRLEEKQQPIRMETGGSVMDQLYGQLMGQIPMGQYQPSYNYDYEYTPYVAGAAPQSAVAAVPDAPLAYGPEDIVIRESGFDFNDGGISGSAATGTSGVGAPSAAQTAANQSFAQAISSPVAESVFGSDVSKGLGVVSGLAGLAGVPGIGQAVSVMNASPIGMLGMALGLMGLGPLGMAVGAFGQAVDVVSSFDVQTSPTGQTQVSGVGNETMDMFGNVVGTPAHTANMLGYSPTDPMNSKVNFSYSTVSDVSPDEVAAQQAVADFAEAHGQEVGDASPGGGMSSDEAATNDAESGQNGQGGHMAQGGVVDFYAQGGGISSLAYGGEAAPVGFANKAFEGMVPGQGTGMSDDVPFSIEGNQPALLSRDEYVLPADVVSQLGDGSSGAGSDMLDTFVSSVRQNKYGNTNQPPPNGGGLLGSLMKAV